MLTMLHWIHRNVRRTTVLVVLCFCALAAFFVITKANALGYDALDLAIFRQTLANTARGDLFGLTIHEPSYLGDHASFLLLAVAPFYAVAPFLVTLPLLQIAIVALSAVPLLLLTRRFLSSGWQLLLLSFFFLSVFTHNLVAFEFEFLVAAVPLLLLAAYHYRRGCFAWTAALLLLVGLVREDLGFILIGFGVMAWCERRSVRWRLTPILLGIATLAAGILVTRALNGEQYKFLSYLGWLEHDGARAVWYRAAFAPLVQLARPENLLVAFALLLSFLFIPLRAPLRLIPALCYWIPLTLTGINASLLNLRVHYVAPLLPFLLWATIEGLPRVLRSPPRFAGLRHHGFPVFLGLLFLGTAVYGTLLLSPFRPAGWEAVRRAQNDPSTAAAKELLRRIPADASLATSYHLLPRAAGRRRLFSLHYAASGKRQLSDRPYVLPDDVDWLLLDANDTLLYPFQYGEEDDRTRGAGTRLRALIEERRFRLLAVEGSLLLFSRTEGVALPPLVTDAVLAQNAAVRPFEALTLEGVAAEPADAQLTQEVLDGRSVRALSFTAVWGLRKQTGHAIALRARIVNDRGSVADDRLLPLAYGLWPTTDWAVPSARSVRYTLLLPDLPKGSYTLQLTPVTVEGQLMLDAALSTTPLITKETPVGPVAAPVRFTL